MSTRIVSTVSTAVIAALVLMAGPAWSQNRDDHEHGGGHDHPGGGGAPAAHAPAPQAAPAAPAARVAPQARQPSMRAQAMNPHAAPAQQARHPGEHYAGPNGYQRPTEPQGWNNRPANVDRGAYQHNYQADRSYHVGPYHRPAGYRAHNWAYGERLPRAYWAPQYILADYWLFSLEVPPAGYEWVRVGDDALLVDTRTGMVLQVEYGVFA